MDVHIPSELTGPSPRRVCATQQGFWMEMGTTLLLAFSLAGTLWMGKNAMQQMQNWEALHRDGCEIVGRVTGTGTGKSRMVYYAFTVNGRSFTGKAYSPGQLFQSLQNSGPLRIRYLPPNPAVNHPADWEHAPLDSAWFMAPLPLVLFGMIFLVSLRRERQLVAEGAPAAGVILQCRYGSRSGYVAKYEFRAEDGKVITSRVGVPGSLEIGSIIWVLYLRQNPRRNQPYPSSNYRVIE